MTAVPSVRLGSLYGLYFAVVALSIGWFGPFSITWIQCNRDWYRNRGAHSFENHRPLFVGYVGRFASESAPGRTDWNYWIDSGCRVIAARGRFLRSLFGARSFWVLLERHHRSV